MPVASDSLGLLRDVARVAAYRLARDRVEDVADQTGSASSQNGSMTAVAGRDEQHVGLVDRLPAADPRAVEAEALLEELLGRAPDRDGEVLPGAGQVDELEKKSTT